MTDHVVDQEVLQAKSRISADVLTGVMTGGAILIGDRVGLYRAMADAGPLTSHELAERAGLNERFVREWLHQQTAAQIIEYRGNDRFELVHEAALVFADTDNPMSRVGSHARLPAQVAMFERAVEAFHTGIGATFEDASDTDGLVRAPMQVWARTALVPQALPKLGDAVQILERGGAVADVGCGAGAAPLAIAKAFPKSRVDGYDNWPGALQICEEEKASERLTNVRFINSDVEGLPNAPTYDLVMTMDCLHDMARPDLTAAAIRKAIKSDGRWFIVETDGHDDFEKNLEHPMAQMGYAVSLILCLQSSASVPDGLGLGTFGLPEPRLRELVQDAGFTRFSRVEGIEHPFNAYYVAQP